MESVCVAFPDSETLRRAIRGEDFHARRASRWVATACRRLKAQKSFAPIGTSSNMKRLRPRRASQKTMGALLLRQSQLLALNVVKKAPPSFFSCGRSYFSFCELKAVRPFPVRENAAIHRIPLFRHSPTFPNYVSYLDNACFFLGHIVAWDTPSVRNVA